jgi:hypothetical protein
MNRSVQVDGCPRQKVGKGTEIVDERVPSVGKLAEAKKFALRRGVWFRALTRVERGVLDLTVKYVESIKSSKLATLVTAIIDKLQIAMENIVDRMVRVVGRPLAQKISQLAASWGNRCASKWADDLEFARYLAVNSANSFGGVGG